MRCILLRNKYKDIKKQKVSNNLYLAIVQYCKMVKATDDVKKAKSVMVKFNELDDELKAIINEMEK